MSNNQATIEDLIDEMYDLLDKGWKMPLSAGKMFVDGEEVRQILDEIKEEIPSEVRKAKAIVADRAQILDEAQREAETIIRVAEEKAKAMVNQDEIVRQAQQKANELIAQAQQKFKEMRKASNDYVDDLMRRADESSRKTWPSCARPGRALRLLSGTPKSEKNYLLEFNKTRL